MELQISIHAPRVGGDHTPVTTRPDISEFQSTPPVWGATPCLPWRFHSYSPFQSTPPVWGATPLIFPSSSHVLVHSTPPVWGATRSTRAAPFALEFQSTPPVWGATRSPRPPYRGTGISIHAPRVGGDRAGRR